MAPLANAVVDQGAPGAEGAPTLRASLPGSTSARIGGSLKARRFGLILSAITLGVLALRVGYVLTVTRYQKGTLYDSFWYFSTTIGLRSGQFFRAPFGLSPSAAHPPMTSLLLGAAAYVVGLHGSATSSLLVMAVLGTAVVFCVGLLGRAVAGPWVGLTAAGLAAVAPNFWIPSGILMSETPAMLFMALILLAVVYLVRRQTVGAAVLLGLACGFEALVRAELILFVPCLLVPATSVARRIPMRRRPSCSAWAWRRRHSFWLPGSGAIWRPFGTQRISRRATAWLCWDRTAPGPTTGRYSVCGVCAAPPHSKAGVTSPCSPPGNSTPRSSTSITTSSAPSRDAGSDRP